MLAAGAVATKPPGNFPLRTLAALLCVLASLPALAAESGNATFQEPLGNVRSATATGVQINVTTLSLPRLDGSDPAGRTQRIDFSMLPRQPSALGISLGLIGASASTPAKAALGGGSSADLSVGMHWRYAPDSSGNQIDILAWRRVSGPTDALALIQTNRPEYGARVELKVNERVRSGLVADRAFVGMQLDGGARLSVKRSAGKPMLYYRNTF